jgi:hypothetical protein
MFWWRKMNAKFKLVTAAMLLIALGSLFPFAWRMTIEPKPLYRLREPMLIAANKGEPYYMLPSRTILRYQTGFAEGHQLYTIDVLAKGLPADQLVAGSPVESTWLYPLDVEDMSKILREYPLSKDELVRILKARKMTRADLAQLAREWKDD